MFATDAPGSQGGNFTDGDPTNGILGTVVDAAWCNEIQGELLNVLAAAGIAPVKGNRTQVRDAILAMIADAFVPIGEPRLHWGPVSTLAENELPLDGRALLRSAYPVLFSRYGTAFQTTASPSEFNIPDLRGTYVIGAGGVIDFAAKLGANQVIPAMQPAGAHNHGGASAGHALSVSELPPHSHTYDGLVTSGPHETGGGSNEARGNITNQSTGQAGSGQAHAHAIGSDGSHVHTMNPVDNRPQSLALSWKIRAL